MRAKDALGIEGEAVAERHLAARGLRILARRARVPSGELDLVALEGCEVVFVEVKTRHAADFGEPEEAVTYAKRCKLRRAAVQWLDRANMPDAPYRIDVMGVLVGGAGTEPVITHFVSAIGETG